MTIRYDPMRTSVFLCILRADIVVFTAIYCDRIIRDAIPSLNKAFALELCSYVCERVSASKM